MDSPHRRRLPSLIVVGIIALVGCSGSLPSKYLREAERGVTLTSLTAAPEAYRGKVVILGGVVKEEMREGGRLWLYMKNRPLDRDYRPHRPPTLDGPEAGHYWLVITSDRLPASYRDWARVTVVGEVLGTRPAIAAGETAPEPVLGVMYLRGWSLSADTREGWEEFEDPHYQAGAPRGLHGEFLGQ